MIWHGKNFRGFLNKAKEVLFNNTGTTLTSTNVEDAIKEVNSNVSHIIPAYNNAASFTNIGVPITPTEDDYLIFVAHGAGDFSLTMSINGVTEIVAGKSIASNEYYMIPYIARKNKTYTINTSGSVDVRVIV